MKYYVLLLVAVLWPSGNAQDFSVAGQFAGSQFGGQPQQFLDQQQFGGQQQQFVVGQPQQFVDQQQFGGQQPQFVDQQQFSGQQQQFVDQQQFGGQQQQFVDQQPQFGSQGFTVDQPQSQFVLTQQQFDGQQQTLQLPQQQQQQQQQQFGGLQPLVGPQFGRLDPRQTQFAPQTDPNAQFQPQFVPQTDQNVQFQPSQDQFTVGQQFGSSPGFGVGVSDQQAPQFGQQQPGQGIGVSVRDDSQLTGFQQQGLQTFTSQGETVDQDQGFGSLGVSVSDAPREDDGIGIAVREPQESRSGGFQLLPSGAPQSQPQPFEGVNLPIQDLQDQPGISVGSRPFGVPFGRQTVSSGFTVNQAQDSELEEPQSFQLNLGTGPNAQSSGSAFVTSTRRENPSGSARATVFDPYQGRAEAREEFSRSFNPYVPDESQEEQDEERQDGPASNFGPDFRPLRDRFSTFNPYRTDNDEQELEEKDDKPPLEIGEDPRFSTGLARPIPDAASRNPDLFPQVEPANNVIDVSVECDMERNRMSVTLTFERDFDGILYTKDFFKVDDCRYISTKSRFQRFDIPLDKCGMRSKASTDNFGGTMQFDNTVVVMNELEWGILEMWDKAYKVSCEFAGDRANTVDTGVVVPGLTSENVQGIMAMPTCRMKVVNGDNPMVPGTNDLVLGEIATLVVYIQESSHFDIYVSHCYAHDGMDMGYLNLVDENGCPVHRKIIGKQQHSQDLAPQDTLVYAHFKAFKFPDVGNVLFECQCRLCMEGCFQPRCDGARKKREIKEEKPEQKVGEEKRIFQSITVRIPEEGDFEHARFQQDLAADASSTSMCVSKTGFTVGVSFFVIVVIIALVAAVLYYQRRQTPFEVFHHNVNLGYITEHKA